MRACVIKALVGCGVVVLWSLLFAQEVIIPPQAGSSGTAVYVNGSSTTNPNFLSNYNVVPVVSGATNVTFTPAPAQTITISASAAATDASLGKLFRISVTGNFTLSNPSNPTDGQSVVWEMTQSGSGGVLTLDSKFALGAEINATVLSVTIGKMDKMRATYVLSADKWIVDGFLTGYTL